MTEQTEFKKGEHVYIAIYSGAYSLIAEGIIEKKLPSRRYSVLRKMGDGEPQKRIVPIGRPFFRTKVEAYNWLLEVFDYKIKEIEREKEEFIRKSKEAEK